MSEPETSWRNISPLYQWELMVLTALGFVPPLVASTLPLWLFPESSGGWLWVALVVVSIIAVVAVAFVPRRVKAIGYALRSDDVVFRRGIIFQRLVAVPYGRLQLVDVARGPVARVLGLSKLSLVTAAASTGVSIPGLPADTAEELRDHLIALAETRRAGL
jgi:hypothetical protein